MPNIDNSLDMIMQSIQRHATADHGRVFFPLKFVEGITTPTFMTGGGRYFDPAAWVNLAVGQMGCFRLTADGKLMVEASVVIGGIDVDIDGIYNAVSNPNPDNVGLIVHQNSVAPGAANQFVRTTGGVAQTTPITGDTFFGIDTRSQLYAFNKAGNLSPLMALFCDPVYFGLAVAVCDVDGNRLPAGDDPTRPIYVTFPADVTVDLDMVNGTAIVEGGVAGLLAIAGNIAHDSVDAGYPIKIGGKASSAKPAAVANNDRVDAYFDLFGRQHVYDEGGGGVSGGGYSTWIFTPSNSFGHGTSAYASGTTFTVSGHSFAPEAVALVKVDRFSAAGVFQETISPSQATVTAATVANVTTYTVGGASFVAGDLFVVYQGGPERTTSIITDSQRTEEINPLSLQIAEESLVDTTNVAASQQWYPSSDGMMMLGYKNLSLSGKYIDGDAVTTLIEVWATNDEDSTATNRDWIRITGYMAGCTGTGLSKDTYTDNITTSIAQTITFAWDFDNLNYKYVRVGVLPGDATNTCIIKARRSY